MVDIPLLPPHAMNWWLSIMVQAMLNRGLESDNLDQDRDGMLKR